MKNQFLTALPAFLLALSGILSAAAQDTGQPSGNKSTFKGKLVLQDLVPPDDRKFELAEDLEYIDPKGVHWYARSGLIFDGASIPRALWAVVGSPYTGTYRRAAVMHDFYCTHLYRLWQDVHRMFYDAMISDGTNPFRAKLMYYAVYRFGPRWDLEEIKTCPDNVACAKPGDIQVQKFTPELDEHEAIAELERVKAELIKDDTTTLTELETLARAEPTIPYNQSSERFSDNWPDAMNRQKSPHYVAPEAEPLQDVP
ncbi:hypothetical protein M728_005770 (plasmid) [Ensifer sp. WSM1721]|uniref:DUF1353 domain-containing protein n=1 Tax=Ensifer sp. WSM1721 TaxID=1041159 RepID=UPI000684B9C2|nr:DUF1353 domain-containing protein [Ensifer sp. WSM1721]